MSLKSVDIRNMNEIELAQKLNELESELFKLRFQSKTGRLDKPHLIGLIKKDVARIKTITRERQNEGKKTQ